MCGLVGAVGSDASHPVDAGLSQLKHRGPDAQRIESGRSGLAWTLGHTRLAINDLSPAGNQPMASEDGAVVIIYNGEIYNYPELRAECEGRQARFRSTMDGEVILHLWREEGPACLSRLNGIFSVAVLDLRTKELFLARDPLGVKPLFYSMQSDGSLYFASEIATLQALDIDLGPLDLVALAQFLTFLWIPDPRTQYEGVRSVEPGQLLRWKEGEIVGRPYSPPLHPEARPDGSYTEAQAFREGEELCRAAIRRQLMSDAPMGLMASGGLDSSLIWAEADDALDRTYTVAWSGHSQEGLEEDTDAVRLCEQTFRTPVEYLSGEDWQPGDLPLAGDLIADPAFALTRMIAKSARARGCKVLFSGQGGDEIFGGYRRHRAAARLHKAYTGQVGVGVASILRRMGRHSIAAEYASRLSLATSERSPFARYMQLCSYSTSRDRAEALGCSEREVSNDVVWQQHAEVFESLPSTESFVRRIMAVDLRVYLPGLGLKYADRAGMEESVEIRVPLLDLELVKWTLQLPDRFFIGTSDSKWLLRRMAQERLPKDVVDRPKRGFGVPAEFLPSGGSNGSRGFRQGEYFAQARRVLAQAGADKTT